MGSFPKHLIFILMVVALSVLLTDIHPCEGRQVDQSPQRIILQNGLANSAKLTVRCWRRDNKSDLGTHVVAPGRSYEFRFRLNKTLNVAIYACSFRWPPKRSEQFDVYDQLVDLNQVFDVITNSG
ncbi:S-protein homolog 4-like [Punica granatum]|uniref:S-protein homolog n=1 Tax=Punica granatum TaxID=22663 RepID=A0A6P8D6T4_PUNGR|nr:S-protein homolog 4-like [Punica granatum]